MTLTRIGCNSLVAARDQRFQDFKSVQSHGYFSEVNWSDLRAKEPPFVPELDSDRDAGYFDDFSNEADMAKYKEVHEKQTALESMEERKDSMSKIAFVGFTFKYNSFLQRLEVLYRANSRQQTQEAEP